MILVYAHRDLLGFGLLRFRQGNDEQTVGVIRADFSFIDFRGQLYRAHKLPVARSRR